MSHKNKKSDLNDLNGFLEDVQWQQGTPEKFDPYFRKQNKKSKNLTEMLLTLEAEDEELPVDDTEDISVDDEGSESSGEGLFIGAGQRYFMGASEDPQMVIVSGISGDKVNYYTFPYSKEETLNKHIASDLMITGCRTFLDGGSADKDPDLKKSIEAVLGGRPGEKVSLDDYKYSNAQVRYTGKEEGDGGPWKELESDYGVKVDSVLANKQTYNLRINNKDLERFEQSLNEKPSEERKFKVVKIVKEDIECFLEAKAEEKPFEVAIAPAEKQFYIDNLTNKINERYSAEGRLSGEQVLYKKDVWTVMDFLSVGDKLKLSLIKPDISMVANLVDFKDVKDITPEDIEKMEEKNEKEAEKAQKKEEKEAEKEAKKAEKEAKSYEDKKTLEFPTSEQTGKTKEQKALKEETDIDERKIEELVLYMENDGELYRNRLTPIVENLKAKKKNDTYDTDLAVGAFRTFVDTGAKKYFDEFKGSIFGDKYNSYKEMFPEVIRIKVAEKFRDSFEDEVGEDMEEATTIEQDVGVFTPEEQKVLKAFDDSVDVSNVNTAVYTWDSGTKSLKTTVNKIMRKKSNDYMYTSDTFSGDKLDQLVKDKSLNSMPFETDGDVKILEDFLTKLMKDESASLIAPNKNLLSKISHALTNDDIGEGVGELISLLTPEQKKSMTDRLLDKKGIRR